MRKSPTGNYIVLPLPLAAYGHGCFLLVCNINSQLLIIKFFPEIAEYCTLQVLFNEKMVFVLNIMTFRHCLFLFQRWIAAFGHQTFQVLIRTNNGLERQNKNLKYESLRNREKNTLTRMVSTMVESFFPEKFKRYVKILVLTKRILVCM